MRKITLALFGLLLLSFLTTSCEKEEAEPQFEKANLIGRWEMIGGTDFTECPSGDNKIMEITESTIREGQTDDEGCDNGGYVELDYVFTNGNTFETEFLGLKVNYKVTNLTGDKMTMVGNSPDIPGASTTYELQKMP